MLRRSGQQRLPTESFVAPEHKILCFEGWKLHVNLRELRSPEDKRIDLTAGEYKLLEAFLHAPQRILSRDQLLDMTRNHDNDVFDRSIDVVVLRLRRKIEPNPKQPRFIRTERNTGYVFTATVQRA